MSDFLNMLDAEVMSQCGIPSDLVIHPSLVWGMVIQPNSSHIWDGGFLGLPHYTIAFLNNVSAKHPGGPVPGYCVDPLQHIFRHSFGLDNGTFGARKKTDSTGRNQEINCRRYTCTLW